MNRQEKTLKLNDGASAPVPETAWPSLRNAGWLVSIGGPGLASGSISVLAHHSLIGSAAECEIRIQNDATVSRQHASIVLCQDNLFYLKDLGATNPVRLNSRELERKELQKLMDGDEIVIGCSVFLFKDLM